MGPISEERLRLHHPLCVERKIISCFGSFYSVSGCEKKPRIWQTILPILGQNTCFRSPARDFLLIWRAKILSLQSPSLRTNWGEMTRRMYGFLRGDRKSVV